MNLRISASFAGEHPLEAGDRLEVAHQPGLVIRILGKAMDRVIVPGAEDDPSRALGRQIPPVAPHPGRARSASSGSP